MGDDSRFEIGFCDFVGSVGKLVKVSFIGTFNGTNFAATRESLRKV